MPSYEESSFPECLNSYSLTFYSLIYKLWILFKLKKLFETKVNRMKTKNVVLKGKV